MSPQFLFRVWSPETIGQLQDMWWDGFSPEEVARALRTVTPTQARDKAHREGFRRNPELKTVKQIPPEPAPVVRGDGSPVTMMNVQDSECRWIYGEPAADAPMCGNKTAARAPFCEHHMDRRYS